MTQFKVGDTVEVKFEAKVKTNVNNGVICEWEGGEWSVPESFCTLIEPPLKVGDWAKERSTRVNYEIRFIDDDGWALLRGKLGGVWNAHISDLTRIEKP